ncbi:hypothetical protein J4466_05470 [Candidatus Pacearchaeota archaeon]|nr:hypothetical protein [Candidatus Pacearchaeota archaeon]
MNHIKSISKVLENIAATELEKLFEKRYTSDFLWVVAINGTNLSFLGWKYNQSKWIGYGITAMAIPYGLYEANNRLNRRN